MIACLWAALSGPPARATTLYDNSSTRGTTTRFAHSGFEFGDEIILTGPASGMWTLTNFQYEYFGFGTDFTNGNALVALRLYRNDGMDGRPMSLIFDSGYSSIPPTPDEGFVLEYTNLCVSVPKNFTWAVEFSGAPGVMGLQSSGLDLYDPPTVGSTYDDYWERSGPMGSWVLRNPASMQPPISFGARAQGLLPGELPGSMALWLKADMGVSGSPVSTWLDQSGNGRTASQGPGMNQPTFVGSVINGLPVVRFDGVDDYLTFNMPVNGLTGMTIFMVAANTSPQTVGTSFAERAALFWNETAGFGTLYLTPFQSQVSFRFGTTQPLNKPLHNRPVSIGSSFSLTTSLKEGGVDSVYTNGVLALAEGGKFTTIAGCTSIGNLGRGYNNNTFYAGDIAEIIIYPRALCPLERGAVESYLTNKYFGPMACTPPSILTQPSDQTVTEPNTATFTVTANGTGPLSYQWQTNGVDVLGATASSYTTPPTTVAADNGKMFRVIVTNLCGAVTSVVATLTVNSPPSIPIPTSDLCLWLKGDAGIAASPVSTWSDQSGNNTHATQGTAASQPTRVNGVLNGKPVVRFDGLDDFLTFNLPVNGLTGMSIFLVAANSPAQVAGPSRAERAAIFWNETAGWSTVYLIPFQTEVSFRFGTTQPFNQPLHTRPASLGANFSISTAIKSGTTDSLYTNGVLALAEGGKLMTIAGCSPTGNVGRGYNNNTFFSGDIAEIIVYKRDLSPGERATVETYLNDKYAITAPPPPSPVPTADLCLWLKADAGIAASPVAQWSDQSANAAHASQGTAASQPTRVNGVLNGKPVVRFDGLDDFLTFNLPVNGLSGMTIFLVGNNNPAQVSGPSRAERAAIFWNETAGWSTLYVIPFQTEVSFRFGTTQPFNQPLHTRPASLGANYGITTALKDGTTDSLYTNGVLALAEGGKLTTIAGCSPTGNLGRGYNNNTFFSGDLAEVLVYKRALTGAERATVEAYLNNKYAIIPPPPLRGPDTKTEPTEVVQLALLAERGEDGTLGLTLVGGQVGATYVLEGSTDLIHWKPLAQITIPAKGPPIGSALVSADSPTGFFRARPK